MKLKLVEEPQYFLNPDAEGITERLILSNETEEPIFKLGDTKLAFKDFEVEVGKKSEESTEVTGINVFIPNVTNEQILEISRFFNMTDEQVSEIRNIKKATLAFTIEPESIKKYIQPLYDSHEKSKKLFQFVDEENNVVLLDFQNYLVAGIQEELD